MRCCVLAILWRTAAAAAAGAAAGAAPVDDHYVATRRSLLLQHLTQLGHLLSIPPYNNDAPRLRFLLWLRVCAIAAAGACGGLLSIAP
jgi:hypothetical protein